jgi:hypothetical protein
VLAAPPVSTILSSDPKPTIELKGRELRFERPGYLPEPQEAARLFDVLCNIAEAIEQAG